MKNRFSFSVITAVYNAEAFLPETVDSLLKQDIGFSNIQLILCDDGSTDGSAAMCDAYAAQYPDNVVVIHKENGGVSSARNAGLERVEGKYVSFLDADDLLKENAMTEVYRFFEEHPETDVVSLPTISYEKQDGTHSFIDKFEGGTRVIRLEEEPAFARVAVSSAFFRSEALQGKSFDARLIDADGTKLMQTVLLEKQTLGVIADVLYLYRSGKEKPNPREFKEWYIPYVENFCLEVIRLCEERYGQVPKFIQNTIASGLLVRLRQQKLPSELLSEEEKTKYRALIANAYSHLDDEIVCAQAYPRIRSKAYALYLKHGTLPKPVGAIEEHLYQYEDGATVQINPSGIVLDFLKVRKGVVTIEASFIHDLFVSEKPTSFFVSVNDKLFPCEAIDRKRSMYSMDVPIGKRFEFRAEFPLSGTEPSYTIRFYRANESGKECIDRYGLGEFFPIEKYRRAYSFENGYVLRYSDGALRLEKPQHSPFGYEARFIKELLRNANRRTRLAALVRIARLLVKPFVKKPIWILSDRMSIGGDNGEALFRYLTKSQKENVKAYFVIDKHSPDYKRLKKVGSVLKLKSLRHKILHLLSSYHLSSQARREVFGGFSKKYKALKDIESRIRFVFLQHGVTKDDQSSWMNRYNKNIYGLVSSARPETEGFRNGDYFYPEENLWETGMPRFDRLYHDERHQLTIMPTWRNSLVSYRDAKTDIRYLKEGAEDSSFFRFFNALINDERLLAAAKQYGYRICFLPHPLLQEHIGLFDQNDSVTFFRADTPYRNVFAESDLILTDYSSVAFDFAYLRKPVVYAQFDQEEFFSGEHTYTKGYFDYDRDGFGEVETSLEKTVDRLIEYMQNGCRLKDCYRERIDAFFAYDDQNNCRRVYEKIRALETAEKE